MNYPPPKQIGPDKNLKLTGMMLPWEGGGPVLLHLLGDKDVRYHLPLFDDGDQLQSVLKRVGVSFETVKMVADGREFLAELDPDVIVVLNMRFTGEGKVRYHQVRRDPAPKGGTANTNPGNG